MREALNAHVAVSVDSSEADRVMHLQDRADMMEEHRKVRDGNKRYQYINPLATAVPFVSATGPRFLTRFKNRGPGIEFVWINLLVFFLGDNLPGTDNNPNQIAQPYTEQQCRHCCSPGNGRKKRKYIQHVKRDGQEHRVAKYRSKPNKRFLRINHSYR